MNSKIETLPKYVEKMKIGYDADVIFDSKEYDIRETVRNSVNIHSRPDGINPTIFELIKNYYNGEYPSDDKIAGPSSLSYQVKDDKKIYIFGEDHSTVGSCKYPNATKISDYLHNLFSNTTKFIDFYLEDSLFRSINSPGDTYLQELRHGLHSCLNPQKRHGCNYKTIRSHFVDARMRGRENKHEVATSTTIGGLNDFLEYFDNDELTEDLREMLERKNVNESIEEYKLYMKSVNQLKPLKDIKGMANYVMKLATSIDIVRKEIKRSNIPVIDDKKSGLQVLRRNKIQAFIETFISTVSNFNITEWSTINWDTYDGAKKGVVGVRIMVNLIMDIYALTRMFKTFNVRQGEHFPKEANHIVYYAGESHAYFLRLFLADVMGFDMMEVRSKDAKFEHCLDMRGGSENLVMIMDFF